MLTHIRRIVVTALILCICILPMRKAQANIGYASDGKVVGVTIAVVAVVALAGFGVYYAVHHGGHSLKGCTAFSPAGLELVKDGGQRTDDTYTLTGEVQGIKPKERVRVIGSRATDKSHGGGFVVTKLANDYGACTTP